MGVAIEICGKCAVKNSAQLLVKSCDFQSFSRFQAIKTDLRSMAKSSNSIKPNLSLHNKHLRLLYHLHHIRSSSKLPWLYSKG